MPWPMDDHADADNYPGLYPGMEKADHTTLVEYIIVVCWPEYPHHTTEECD